MRIDPKQEAAKTLFNIMFDELAEFNLSNYELASLFVTLVAMSAISYEKGAQEQRGILYFVDCSLEKCNQHEIEDACNCLEMNKYALRYFAHIFGQNSHLSHILRSYTKTYELPKNKQDIMDFISGYYDRDKYNDYVCERIKNSENNNLQWYLKTLHEKTTIQVPNAVYIWPESEGFFRFIDKNGKWGFVDQYTLKITMLPDNVIEMNDFKKHRARVLVGNLPITSIPHDNKPEFDVGQTDYLYWNFVDTSGNFINDKHYSYAEDFDSSSCTAKVSMSQKGAYWGFMTFEDEIPCPYDKMEIDLFGNFTDECEEKTNEALSKAREWELKRKKRVAERRFFKDLYSGSDDEDNIMGALEHGNGDIYGF